MRRANRWLYSIMKMQIMVGFKIRRGNQKDGLMGATCRADVHPDKSCF